MDEMDAMDEMDRPGLGAVGLVGLPVCFVHFVHFVHSPWSSRDHKFLLVPLSFFWGGAVVPTRRYTERLAEKGCVEIEVAPGSALGLGGTGEPDDMDRIQDWRKLAAAGRSLSSISCRWAPSTNDSLVLLRFVPVPGAHTVEAFGETTLGFEGLGLRRYLTVEQGTGHAHQDMGRVGGDFGIG